MFSHYPTAEVSVTVLHLARAPETPGPRAALSPDLKPVFLLLTFTHSPKAFIQSDVELSGTDEGPVQGLKTLEGLLSSKSADECVYDDLKKQHFYLELCSHQIYTSYP